MMATRPRGATFSENESPAMPLPRMMKSKVVLVWAGMENVRPQKWRHWPVVGVSMTQIYHGRRFSMIRIICRVLLPRNATDDHFSGKCFGRISKFVKRAHLL